MGSRVKLNSSKFVTSLLAAFCFCLSGCGSVSIPNLEEPQCTESREIVKKFYSIHFDGNMLFSPENLKLREKFLTPEFISSLQTLKTDNDVFTTDSPDIPRAFRLGDCQVVEPNKTNIEVLLLWKNGEVSRQQIIRAEAVKQADKWLINKILR